MPENSKFKFSENPVFIFFMLYFLLFASALPMLWRSPRFSVQEKWVMTFVSLLETGIILERFSRLLILFFERMSYVGAVIDQIK